MKKILLLLLGFTLFFASASFATASWQIIDKIVSSEVVHAIDANTLVVGGNGVNTLEVWTLGGTNKTVPTISGTAPKRISGISFPTSLVGYAVGEDTAGSPALYKTTDGGTTWTKSSYSGFSTRLQKVAFYDADHGYVLDTKDGSDNTRLFYTADGGTTWSSTTFNGGFDLLACSSSTAIILGIGLGPGPDGYYGSGTSFTQIIPSLSLTYIGTLKSVAHRSGNVFFAVGTYDTGAFSSAIKTEDGGVTWTTVPALANDLSLRDIKFFDENNGIAVGDNGTIIQTTDGGTTWITVTSPTTSDILSVTGTTSITAYANRAITTTSILKYVTNPEYISITPSSITIGASAISTTVTGTGIQNGAVVTFGGTGITNSLAYSSATQLTGLVTVDVATALGSKSITITNPDGGAGSGDTALTIISSVGVTSIIPGFGIQGWTGLVTVEGAGFATGITAAFSGTGITVNNVVFNSTSKLTLEITIASNATVGSRTLTLTNLDGGVLTRTNGFDIRASSGTDTSQITVFVSPNPIKEGNTAVLQFVNPSNRDITGNIIFISPDGNFPLKTEQLTVLANSSRNYTADITDISNGMYPVWMVGNDGTKIKTLLVIAR